MKKNFGFKIVYILAALLMILNVAFTLHNSLFFDINELPNGTLYKSVMSPDGKNVINIYTLKNSIGCAVRGETVCENGDENSARNIYWQTGVEDAEIGWASDKTVIINGVFINLENKTAYDCRRGTSLFQEGALEGIAADNVREENAK